MRVGHGIQQPTNIFGCAHNPWQPENLDGRVVGVDTHIDITLVADGHDSLEEVFQVGAQLCLVDTVIECEQLAELLNRGLVVFAEVAADEALGLDYDVLHKLVLALGRHYLRECVGFG